MNDLFGHTGGAVPLGEVMECESCGGRLFRPVILIRKVSGIATAMRTDGIAPIQVFRCDDCNAVNMNLIPRGAGTPQELFGFDPDEDTNDKKIIANE